MGSTFRPFRAIISNIFSARAQKRLFKTYIRTLGLQMALKA